MCYAPKMNLPDGSVFSRFQARQKAVGGWSLRLSVPLAGGSSFPYVYIFIGCFVVPFSFSEFRFSLLPPPVGGRLRRKCVRFLFRSIGIVEKRVFCIIIFLLEMKSPGDCLLLMDRQGSEDQGVIQPGKGKEICLNLKV